MNTSAYRRRRPAICGIAVALLAVATTAVLVGCGGTATSPGPAAPAGPTTPGTQPSSPGQAGQPSTAPATMTVRVFFHKSTPAGGKLAAVTRTVPYTPAVATTAMTQLLAGPTAAERNAGIWSWFSGRTAGMLRGIRISGGVAYADFRDFRHIIPNASSSAGSAALLDELDATLKQFPAVHSTVYSFNGDVPAFYEWLQRVPPSTG